MLQAYNIPLLSKLTKILYYSSKPGRLLSDESQEYSSISFSINGCKPKIFGFPPKTKLLQKRILVMVNRTNREKIKRLEPKVVVGEETCSGQISFGSYSCVWDDNGLDP